jgi:hypothetical protein
MRDAAQLDLFAAFAFGASNVTAKINTPPILPSRSGEWDRHIAGCAALARQRIHVSAHWTGIVLERLVDHDRGHWLLWSDGTFVEYGPRPRLADKPLRLIHMTAEGARSLHRWAPLVQEWFEPAYAWFRFAEGGEVPAIELRMPGGMT